ncbi:MAG: hypothetical protein DWQ02_10825 [Bacteroidetes bacterium]|nr:MAG: hypothetical protein DWQ02_10825 [Bacteroidota bacterium]
MESSNQKHLETLGEIRSMMERSSRFISLSGLSGVMAGIFALAGAGMVYWYLDMVPFEHKRPYYVAATQSSKWGMDYATFFLLIGGLVLLLAITFGIFFTVRKARKKELPVWDSLTRRLLLNLAIPLFAGGVFCFGMMFHGIVGFIAPATLIFYGLALVNASKYTLNDIRFLGYSEILLGLIALFLLGFGLEFWAIGFGVLHIVYGMAMYLKYERV